MFFFHWSKHIPRCERQTPPRNPNVRWNRDQQIPQCFGVLVSLPESVSFRFPWESGIILLISFQSLAVWMVFSFENTILPFTLEKLFWQRCSCLRSRVTAMKRFGTIPNTVLFTNFHSCFSLMFFFESIACQTLCMRIYRYKCLYNAKLLLSRPDLQCRYKKKQKCF